MEKQVSRDICDERTKNISDKLDDIKALLNKIMSNDLVHVQMAINKNDADIKVIKEKIKNIRVGISKRDGAILSIIFIIISAIINFLIP